MPKESFEGLFLIFGWQPSDLIMLLEWFIGYGTKSVSKKDKSNTWLNLKLKKENQNQEMSNISADSQENKESHPASIVQVLTNQILF